MKSKLSKILFLLVPSFACAPVFADTTYDAKGNITDEQLNTVISTILKVAPSGTTVNDLNFKGSFTLNDEEYLTALDATEITFKVNVKVAFIPISSRVTLNLAATFPTLDCETPHITRTHVSGTNWIVDGQIRKHIDKNAISIVRDNLISQTGLVDYCKFKPAHHTLIEPLDFEF